jgi:ssDNA-binding Zn-finger/Zn-ribbon topoisomerase 1
MSVPYGKVLDHPCPDCGANMTLRRSRFGPFYGCVGYPKCKGTHGAHKASGEPLGIPANAATKRARIGAHDVFDVLWKGEGAPMKRRNAYRWLADEMGLEKVHIGELDESGCARVIAAVETRP